jgi:hypothetical protein
MKDLGYPITSGSGVAVAQDWYRTAFRNDALSIATSGGSTVEDVA